MHPRIQKWTVWIFTLFILLLALLVMGVRHDYFIAFAIIFAPFLLLIQAWIILRTPKDPPDEDDHHPDRWYER